MKKRIWLVAGIAGILLGNLTTASQAEARYYREWRRPYWGWGGPYWGWGGLSFVIDTRPNFVVLPDYGFSVAVGSPYDMIYYDNLYYIYNNNYWYRSSLYNGPWVVVKEENLPDKIKSRNLEDIKRARDLESRNNDSQKQKGHRDDKNSNTTENRKSNNDKSNDNHQNDTEKNN